MFYPFTRNVISFLSLAALLVTPVLAHDDHEHHTHHSECASHEHVSYFEPTIQIAVASPQPLEKDKEMTTTLTLTYKKDGRPVTLADLKEVHTEKVHLLIFDQTLNDYQHIHPKHTDKAGEFSFTWTPKKDGLYRLWADLVPTSTNQQEYAVVDIPATVKDFYPVQKALSLKPVDGDLAYTLSFDQENLKAGKAALGEINIADKEGKPFQGLEPIMGTFAHIVAISEDYQTVEHVHPLGVENPKPDERGGPKMQFHLAPSKAGYLKIYVQVQTQGKSHFIPFGIQVTP